MLSKGFSASSREICVAVDYKGELRCPLGLPTGEASKTYCTSLRSYKNRWAAVLKVNHGAVKIVSVLQRSRACEDKV